MHGSWQQALHCWLHLGQDVLFSRERSADREKERKNLLSRHDRETGRVLERWRERGTAGGGMVDDRNRHTDG